MWRLIHTYNSNHREIEGMVHQFKNSQGSIVVFILKNNCEQSHEQYPEEISGISLL